MSLTNDIPSDSIGETPVGFEHWLELEKGKIISMTAAYRSVADEPGNSVVEFTIAMMDGKNHCRRVPLGEGKVEETARMWLKDLEKQSGLAIPLTVASSPRA
jgi:hypothetical protein